MRQVTSITTSGLRYETVVEANKHTLDSRPLIDYLGTKSETIAEPKLPELVTPL